MLPVESNEASSHRLDGAACAIPPTPSFIVHFDFFSVDASTLASQRKHSIEGVDRLHHARLAARSPLHQRHAG